MRVIIADDFDGIREHLRNTLLKIDGIELIAELENGIDARNEIIRLKPDLAILDIRLPGKSGIDILREVKQAAPDVKIMMLTNFPFPQYKRRCSEEGADYFLDKSTDFDQIPLFLTTLRDRKSTNA